MKNNILMDLKEYKKMLEEKFGFNDINIPSDDYHTSLDGVGNGINLYFRERLGNLLLDNNSINENNDKVVYFYTDYSAFSKVKYKLEFDKNNNSFILFPFEIKDNINPRSYDVHFLFANLSELTYLMVSKDKKYFLLETLKFGDKVDVVQITSKYYDRSFLNISDEYEDLIRLVIDINDDKSNIIPEVEFISKIYEDTIEVSTKKHINCTYFNFIKDNLIIINGVVQGTLGFKCSSSSYFHEREDVDLMVYWYFKNINENSEMLSKCLGLDEEFIIDKNSFVKRLRRF